MEEACSNPSSDGAEGSLHEKYLRVLLYASISKAPTEFALFQQTCVCGVFSSTKVDTSEINVELLNTPIGQLQSATIRGSDMDAVRDIIYITVVDPQTRSTRLTATERRPPHESCRGYIKNSCQYLRISNPEVVPYDITVIKYNYRAVPDNLVLK
ncbi:hypothetical protein SeMB42_g06852 [Synchytrium endobioticum]|uniref:Uncharacterized protein n=1 Tax=Synchytrium endobioticum TaxID=286115 RepID=A0A507CIA3_9FUNG|nr:hypothetical protein SeMB42_g06852 [Synchytrium endobioticum]